MAIALGVTKIEYGTVGNGIPATSFTEIPDEIAEGSVVFSFSEPTETNIMSETSDIPVEIIVTKEDSEYIEFALISPVAATLALFGGGTATGEKWEAPTAVPSVNKTIKVTSKTNGGYKWEYTIVNAKIVAKLNQAPAKKSEEQYLVRCYIQSAITSAGVMNTPFIRERVSA